jgi:hypothetical protein
MFKIIIESENGGELWRKIDRDTLMGDQEKLGKLVQDMFQTIDQNEIEAKKEQMIDNEIDDNIYNNNQDGE